ncbi:MAG: hypothetical protein AAF211_06190 [Myxococcota bacterium]
MTRFLLLFAVGCEISAPAGQPGPEGPTGPEGAIGPEGPAAPQPFASEWVMPTGYTSETLFGTTVISVDIPAPEIDAAVLDGGQVTVYGALEGYLPEAWPTGEVQVMPITLMYDFYGVQIDHWSARLREGAIQIRFSNSENTYDSVEEEHLFRYVVIPPE